jgi:AcrR family transcriptional regulator
MVSGGARSRPEVPRPPVPPPLEANEGRLCEAMVDLVLERGFEAARTAEVSARAGLSRDEFDGFFASPEDCFLRAYWSLVAGPFERCVFDAYERERTWREGLRAAGYAAARFIVAYRRECQFGSIAMMEAGPMAQAHREGQLQHIVELIDAGRQELPDPDSLGRSVAEGTLGSVYMAAVREVSGERSPDFEALVPELMYIAVRPYLGHDLAREELSIPPPPASGERAER